MIIKADNRGRLALGKAAEGSIRNMSHTEWDVTFGSGEFKVKPVTEDPKSKWEQWSKLTPEQIGRVIYVDVNSLPGTDLTTVRDWKPAGIAGVLEWFTTDIYGNEVVEVKLSGKESIKFPLYGVFWVNVE